MYAIKSTGGASCRQDGNSANRGGANVGGAGGYNAGGGGGYNAGGGYGSSGGRAYGAVAGGGYGAGRGNGYAGPPRGGSGGGPGGPYRRSGGYNNKGGRGGRPKRDFVMTEAMKKLYNNFDPLCHLRKVHSVPLVLVETSPSFLFDGITANVAEESKDMNKSTVIVPMDSEYVGGEFTAKSDECAVTVEAATPIDVLVPVTTEVETAVLNDTVMNTGTVMEPTVPMSNDGTSTCNGMTKIGDEIGTAISDCANCRRFANGTINVEMLASFLANLGHTLINFAAKLEDDLKQSN